MVWIILLGVLCVILVIALGGKMLKTRLSRGDGAIDLPLKPIRGITGGKLEIRESTPPPAAPVKEGDMKKEDLLDEEFIDKLSYRIASKIEVKGTTPERSKVDLAAEDEVECVSIDDSLIDPGSDISKLESEGIEATEEVKKDDIKKAKKGLSQIKKKRKRGRPKKSGS